VSELTVSIAVQSAADESILKPRAILVQRKTIILPDESYLPQDIGLSVDVGVQAVVVLLLPIPQHRVLLITLRPGAERGRRKGTVPERIR
jgi:hypothetical protein